VAHDTDACQRIVTQDPKIPCRQNLPPWAVACIAGAVGECGAEFCLYPAETIKVLCQKNSQSAWATLQALLQAHNPLSITKRLFRGVGGAMASSALLGAAYLVVFRETTKFFSFNRDATPEHCATAHADTWCHACARHISLCACSQAIWHENCHSPAAKGDTASGGVTPKVDGLQALALSAVATSFILALLQGPIAMARNQLQADMVKGNLLAYTFSAQGLRSTLPMLGPYCLTAVPHDFAELVVYQMGTEAIEKRKNQWPIKVELLDALVGAAAGFIGVILSAPADCVKTKVITMSMSSDVVRACGNPRMLMNAGVFVKCLAVTRFIWAKQGFPGFFVGTMPRLVEEVPGAILHWCIVSGLTRWLEGSQQPTPQQ
jgi:hypothetical protein